MRPIGWMLLTIVAMLIGAGYFLFTKRQFTTPQQAALPPIIADVENKIIPQQKIMSLTLTSPAFEMNGTIPALYTCDGKGISPELIFSNIPEGTLGLALTMEDPDVPKSVRADGMWNHWIVWNMSPTTIRIGEGGIPPGIVGKNTGGKAAYGGPCPPDREHRYIFTLYALDAILSLPQGSTKEELLQALSGHIIEQTQLIGRYNRK